MGSVSSAGQGSAFALGATSAFSDPSRPGVTILQADLMATPTMGTLMTTVSAGFIAGFPPFGTSMITVMVAGDLLTGKYLETEAGGYAAASAEISITIEEWSARRFPIRRPLPTPTLLNTFTSNPESIFNVWSWPVLPSFQADNIGGRPVVCVFAKPINALLQYRCRINLVQSVSTEAFSGPAEAISNVQYEFPPVFFDFTNP